MKRLLLSATGCLSLFATVTKAQDHQPCNTYRMQEIHTKNIPGYKAQLDAANEQVSANYQAYLNKATSKMSNVIPASYTFTIPVVFHILHLGGTENVPDADCIAALASVNSDYARMGSDTNTIDPLYDTAYINSHIHFELAKKDPYGNCTNGIVHHYDANTNWQQAGAYYNYPYSNYGTYNWTPNRYLNIYIVKNIIDDGSSAGTIIGYTYIPGTSPNFQSDAIVYTGSGPWLTNPVSARSLSHEIGHWLGLSHTFGSNNNAGVMCGNDDIADTPRTAGFFSTCPLPYTALNDSCDPGKRPNMNNIMDYSGCPKMFTRGQTAKMRSTLENSVANRDYVVDTANLVFTGIWNQAIVSYSYNPVKGKNDTLFSYSPATTTPCAPISDFASNKIQACNGQAVIYSSTAYNTSSALSYQWTFEGGTPATSTNAVETVTYSAPGIFGTTLTVTSAEGASTKSVSQYNHVFWNSDTTSLPFIEGFENGVNYPDWYITNKDFGSITWQGGNYGSFSSKCLMLPNANGGFFPGDIDIIESKQFNFANTSSITISYDYSYARKAGTTLDTFKLQYSIDCGGTWQNVLGATSASQMAASGGTLSAPYVPWNQSKWVTKTIPSTLLGALTNKRDVKFRLYFRNDVSTGASQNLYIDNFNITGVVGIEELESTIGLSIYPNPTSSSSIVEFTSPVDSKVSVIVNDVTGRLVETGQLSAPAGHVSKYVVNQSSKLQSGVYFVTLNLDGQKITKKLIVQ